MARQADSSIPPKTFVLRGYNDAKVIIPFQFTLENIVGTGENAGYQHFHLFPQCFKKPPFKRFINPLLTDQLWTLSKFKDFADNFRSDENGRKFSRRVE